MLYHKYNVKENRYVAQSQLDPRLGFRGQLCLIEGKKRALEHFLGVNTLKTSIKTSCPVQKKRLTSYL